ncbi:hypothetical protein CC86DRAFT_332974 [Ophiobolus disseminans]|uniref:Putative zinc-finger domain-containing protein n=1 Tax=Ophiobolus disseminans TaxID=1469910 RepID=A0A6A6ZI10_9PLEO|nr:hypothetical protein CC86DRAFT_332974 [Ophiobolus disseminans]
MANNYSQPYYGLPFQYPPPQQMQQPVPNAPADAQGGQYSAPVPHAFLPGLSAPSPNANQMSFGHNSQQPPFSPAAWPPHDPNAWFAMMQNAIANGQPPPPLPGFGFPPPFPPPQAPQTPQHPAPPMGFPPQAAQPLPARFAGAVGDRVQEVMDSDREDGEVSEGEMASRTPAAKVNGRAHQEPPRSVPPAKSASPRVQEAYDPDQPAAGQKSAKEPVQKTPQAPAPQNRVDALQQDRDHAKQFIKLLHSNNIGYRTLAKEPLDLDQLRGLYQSLNLPSEPAPILPPKPTAAPTKAPAHASASSLAVQPVSDIQQHKPTPTVKTNISAVPPAKSVPSPVDRKDYVARLQAVKLAKANAAKPSPPQNTPPVVAAPPPPPPPPPAVKTPQPATTPTAKPPATEEQRARQTEIIRQRLEVMKAKNAAALALNGAPSTPSMVQKTQIATSGTTTPNTQPFKSPFPGIPGLFMNPPPSVDSTTSKPAPSVPQKRPAPSESGDMSTPRGSVTPYTRPLGDSPHAYQDEPMLIDVSEDESNGSDMDIDDDQPPLKSAVTSPATNQQRQNPVTFPDFPARPPTALPASSTVSTPGTQTPYTQAREQELKSKEDQLAAMRLTLKKKLAEKREKDRAAAAAAAATSTAPQNPSTAVTAPRNSTTQPTTPMFSSSPTMPVGYASASSDIMNDASELIRDVKRRRREEIQTKLPSFDAEFAANTNKMAQLMKEMELLKAHNEKIAQNKERLTRELESLGVDTEGMSHAELRAKKDEIEHEKSPEPEASKDLPSSVPTDAPLEQSLVPRTEAADDVDEIAQTQEVAAVSAQDDVLDEQIALPGLGRGQHNIEQGLAPSHATTVDEAQVSGPVFTSTDVLPSTSQTLSQTKAQSSPAMTPIAQETATPLDEEDDFYSPAPAVESTPHESMDLDNTLQAEVAADVGSAISPSEEGEVEMSLASDDEEEEYEPEESIVTPDAPAQDAQAPELELAKSLVSNDLLTEEEEAYEPPDVGEELIDIDVVDPVAAVDIAVPDAEVNGTVPEAEVEAEDGAMDIASSSSEDSESESDGEITSGNDETISANHGSHQIANIADDLAQELQPDSATQAAPAEDDEPELPKFTPYESPLRMFKSYRYHPNFAHDVSGGFLSPTFSHQIDAEKPFCQYETAGGSCNDPECPNQHFRGMGITGETLLVQLGTANPGKSTEEKQNWNDGLRGVLKELRKKSIKDPNGIAVEIAKYRRQFLADDTRVVNL